MYAYYSSTIAICIYITAISFKRKSYRNMHCAYNENSIGTFVSNVDFPALRKYIFPQKVQKKMGKIEAFTRKTNIFNDKFKFLSDFDVSTQYIYYMLVIASSSSFLCLLLSLLEVIYTHEIEVLKRSIISVFHFNLSPLFFIIYPIVPPSHHFNYMQSTFASCVDIK